MTSQPPARPASYDKMVALVLQGGGALGAYQAGVYEALAASEYLPDWIAGISIGAVNGAIIAGNAPEHRVERLSAFWNEVTSPLCPAPPALGSFDVALAAASALMFGQNGFFAPRPPLELWFGSGATSLYDTSALRSTLERLVDFDRINSKETRYSVGAVHVETGNLVYFDNARMKIGPEHVMASGAMPPGFPAIEIGGEAFWDGGLVSNTPLRYVVENVPRRSRLIFQVDLYHAHGRAPKNLGQVAEREKDIRYSSRTRALTDTIRRQHDVRHNINELWERLPPELRELPCAKWLYDFGCVTTMDVAHLIYRPGEPQGPSKDFDFGRQAMESRWQAGLADAQATLAASPWLAPMDPAQGARTFDVRRPAGKPERDSRKM
jgi:NTE family protein